MNLRLITVTALLGLSACTDGYLYPPPQTSSPRGAGVGGGGGFRGSGGGTGTGGAGAGCFTAPEDAAPVRPPVEPPPLIGGTMVALAGGGFVIGDADRSLLWIVPSDLSGARQVALSPGDEPGRAVETRGHVYVVLRRADQLAELDVAAGTLRRLDTCHLPRGLATRDGALVVACLGGELEAMDPVSGARTQITTNSQLTDLRDVVVDGERLIVTQLRSAAISTIERDGTVRQLSTAALTGFVPHVAWRAVSTPSGGAMVVRQQHRSARLPSVACAYYGNTSPGSGGGAGNGGGVVQAEAVSISGGAIFTVPLSGGFSPTVLPVDLAVSPSGRLAVVSAGTGSLSLLQLGAQTDVPLVEHELDTQLTSVVFSGESAFVFVRQPARLLEVSPAGALVRSLSLPGASVASSGHEIFHRATSSNIACASCHPEAGEDGHLWPFFEGARRTPTLRGGLAGTAPFHWSGDLPSMSALMADVMVRRMSGPMLSEPRIHAVELWLNAQPAVAPPVGDAAAVERGRTLFESSTTACSSCHSGPKGTNNATVDVGTGAAFQVPRLAEFAWRAPWFHDGRMASLEARFNASSGGESHGHVSELTPQDRLDLMEYLKSR